MFLENCLRSVSWGSIEDHYRIRSTWSPTLGRLQPLRGALFGRFPLPTFTCVMTPPQDLYPMIMGFPRIATNTMMKPTTKSIMNARILTLPMTLMNQHASLSKPSTMWIEEEAAFREACLPYLPSHGQMSNRYLSTPARKESRYSQGYPKTAAANPQKKLKRAKLRCGGTRYAHWFGMWCPGTIDEPSIPSFGFCVNIPGLFLGK